MNYTKKKRKRSWDKVLGKCTGLISLLGVLLSIWDGIIIEIFGPSLSLGANDGATVIPSSFTRSHRDTSCLSQRIHSTSSHKRALLLRVTFASCIMKAKWSFIEERGRAERGRNLEDGTPPKESSELSIANGFLVEIASMIDKSTLRRSDVS